MLIRWYQCTSPHNHSIKYNKIKSMISILIYTYVSMHIITCCSRYTLNSKRRYTPGSQMSICSGYRWVGQLKSGCPAFKTGIWSSLSLSYQRLCSTCIFKHPECVCVCLSVSLCGQTGQTSGHALWQESQVEGFLGHVRRSWSPCQKIIFFSENFNWMSPWAKTTHWCMCRGRRS